ncbi:hypothetical protein GCM10023194_62550 [Planotetraspora phitsanulokensis]|uniref:Beta-lactamase class A catalytic domain-containing protein n=1 Tax=Planotetraspora phitsanulokensis TaxID=575192 RepID=A0A8J3U365_9ACTN|nr:serine hydrolase [Planotetraspora phitsanulokensis]GII37524.1 hypothetical protein Pph01_25270 [Planotetraspora phitsanulokensis]
MTFKRPRDAPGAALQPAPRHGAVLRAAVALVTVAVLIGGGSQFTASHSGAVHMAAPSATIQAVVPAMTPTPAPSPTPSPTPTPAPKPVFSKSARKDLSRRVGSYLRGRSGQVSVQIQDLSTGLSYGYNADMRHATASIVKVDILATLLLRAQREKRALSRDERALATRMITESDNNAADALWYKVGGSYGVAAANKKLKLRHTTVGPAGYWGATMTDVADQIRLLKSLTSDKSPLNAKSRRYALGLMGDVVSSQDWGVSAAAGRKDTTELKNGWLPRKIDGDLWTINSIGRVQGDDHDYLIAVLSSRTRSMGDGIATVEHVAEMVSMALTKAISAPSTSKDA